MSPRRKFWSLIVVVSMVAAVLVGFAAWEQLVHANSQSQPYKLDADTLHTFSHDLGVEWHPASDDTPTIIDFGGVSSGAPAGLDQWLAEQGAPVQAAGIDADVLGAKKAVVLRVYFNDYANTTRFSQTDVEDIVDSMNDLWKNTSYNKINVTREVSDLFQLPDDRDEYIDDLPPCEPDPAIQPLGDLSCGGKFTKVLEDAVDNAPVGVDWTDTDTVFVLMAETDNSQFHRGQATTCNLPIGPGGASKTVGCVIISENPTETEEEITGARRTNLAMLSSRTGRPIPATTTTNSNAWERGAGQRAG